MSVVVDQSVRPSGSRPDITVATTGGDSDARHLVRGLNAGFEHVQHSTDGDLPLGIAQRTRIDDFRFYPFQITCRAARKKVGTQDEKKPKKNQMDHLR